ncbi:GAF domain-containing protein [Salinicoccus sp. ID82-1]|uniref:GAF domain-containing protein n=1 Tax=Salinicoccus sp. ID82-1 TaxID=2820269 RepID=UPI001F371479|nr:GAF domain-containing protein [Salinicoccus sp. ID82-1]MCG1010227.1 GAF domain-containing protein [Salinicoccus sp. ID82-1]
MNEISIEVTLSDIQKTFDFDLVALTDIRVRQTNYMIRWKYSIGSLGDQWKRIALQRGKGVPGTVMKTGKSMIITDITGTDMERDLFRYPILKTEQLQSFIAMPLWNDDEEVMGILLMGNRDSRMYTKAEYEMVKQHVEKTLRQQILKELMVNE